MSTIRENCTKMLGKQHFRYPKEVIRYDKLNYRISWYVLDLYEATVNFVETMSAHSKDESTESLSRLVEATAWVWCDTSREMHGPISGIQLVKLATDGEVDGETLVFAHPCPPPYEHIQLSWGAWKTVREIPALKERLQAEENKEEVDASHAFTLPTDDDEQEAAAKAAYLAEIQMANAKDKEKDQAQDKKRGRAKEGDRGGRVDKKKQSKKSGGKQKGHNWVYVSGLPSDVTEDEVLQHFTKVGVLAINPATQAPKFKLYRDEQGVPKGDASLCYLQSDSVDMALTVLHEGYLRLGCQISVTRADFSSAASLSAAAGGTTNGDGEDATKGERNPHVAPGQIQVMQAAQKQSLTWNEDDDGGGLRKRDQLTIVVLHHAFDQAHSSSLSKEEDKAAFFASVEKNIVTLCEPHGRIDKITVFSRHPDGVVIVRYHTNYAAQQLVEAVGRSRGGMRASYWDGTTDYSLDSSQDQDQPKAQPVQAKEEEGKKKMREKEEDDEYSSWLEGGEEELPEELRVRTE